MSSARSTASSESPLSGKSMRTVRRVRRPTAPDVAAVDRPRSSAVTGSVSVNRTTRSMTFGELAHVARPGVLPDRLLGFGRQRPARRRVAPAACSRKPRASSTASLSALAQRRDADHRHRQPLVEVLAELAETHRGLEVAVGGGDDLHVDRASAVAPIRRTVFSSMTFRNFDCSAGETWPISSRKMVPPSAVSNSPARAVFASVKAPRSWPNSSASTRCSGRAVQLTSMNGPSRRPPVAWIAARHVSLAAAGLAEQEHGRRGAASAPSRARDARPGRAGGPWAASRRGSRPRRSRAPGSRRSRAARVPRRARARHAAGSRRGRTASARSRARPAASPARRPRPSRRRSS